jgi:hypothetical protein
MDVVLGQLLEARSSGLSDGARLIIQLIVVIEAVLFVIHSLSAWLELIT